MPTLGMMNNSLQETITRDHSVPVRASPTLIDMRLLIVQPASSCTQTGLMGMVGKCCPARTWPPLIQGSIRRLIREL